LDDTFQADEGALCTAQWLKQLQSEEEDEADELGDLLETDKSRFTKFEQDSINCDLESYKPINSEKSQQTNGRLELPRLLADSARSLYL
jgi:hypothetical protein